MGPTMTTETNISLPEHYERLLGEIACGWSDDTLNHGIQVVSFKNQPEAGVTTFATLGLSKYVLNMSGTRRIRQEILVSANENSQDVGLSGFLLSLAEFVVERGSALLRGEVIGPGKPVIAGSTLTAVYVTNPSPFDKALTKFDSEPPDIVFAYLIPITATEASLVGEHGWRWFEDELENQNPDIWNLTRSEQVLAR